MRVLAADDDISILRALERTLRRLKHTVITVDSGEAALATVGEARPDVILLDVEMRGISGLDTLTRLGREAPGVPVVIMTGRDDVETAVHAFKRGAVDFVRKPFTEATIEAALAAIDEARVAPTPRQPDAMVGASPRFKEAFVLAERLARPDINVLLEGETGTGKELFAKTLHDHSKRKGGPFVAVDCSALAESLIESELFGHEKGAFTGAIAARMGVFERANGGTIFLDELGNLSMGVQAKLLRVLQERTVERVGGGGTKSLDVRVISATNVDLRDASKRGVFRSDLYFRLAEAIINPPPLRERRGDVRLLAESFVQRYAARFEAPAKRLAPEALARLEAYAWPGNVRELESVIKVAVALADDCIELGNLPVWIQHGAPGPNDSGPAISVREAPLSEEYPPSAQGAPSTRVQGGRCYVDLSFDVGEEPPDLKALALEACEKVERALLEHMVRQGRYNLTRLATVLNLDQKTLRKKLRKYGLDA
jgi:DNA-binding NtrC family response regulator